MARTQRRPTDAASALAAAPFAQVRLAALARLRLADLQAHDRYRGTASWPFFAERVLLIDPLAPLESQVAPYPDFLYTRGVVHEMDTQRQLIFWKSRRMIISWSVLAYFLRRAAYLPNQRLFVIAKKEGDNAGEGSRELIWRTAWMAAHVREGPPIPCLEGKLHLQFPQTGSTITGMSCEPNAMRQLSANGVFCDEFGHWEHPQEAYRALRPTIEGRGQVIIACSTADGYFKQLVYDEGDSWMAPDAVLRARPRSAQAIHQYVPGMEAWTNAGNGFRVVAIDHWADPRKPQGSAWEAQERKGMTQRDWNVEYLRKFLTTAGRPVLEHEWRPATMVVAPFRPAAARRLIVSLDFGYNRPAATVSTFRHARIWTVLRAHLGHQIHFTPFLKQLQVLLAEWFPGHERFLWCCDAAGKQKGHDAEPEVETLRKVFGIRPRFRYSRVEATIDRMRDYMTETYRGEPCFQVVRHPSTRIVIDALGGGWHYPEAQHGTPEPDLPEDDGFYIHVMDTLRYTGLNFGGPAARRDVDLAALARREILPPRNYLV